MYNAYYDIKVETSYLIDDSTLFDARINDYLEDRSFNNTSGYIIVMLIIFILVNVLMAKYANNLGVISFMNLFLLVLFIFFGWIDLWVSVLIGLVIIIGIILGFKGGGSDE